MARFDVRVVCKQPRCQAARLFRMGLGRYQSVYLNIALPQNGAWSLTARDYSMSIWEMHIAYLKWFEFLPVRLQRANTVLEWKGHASFLLTWRHFRHVQNYQIWQSKFGEKKTTWMPQVCLLSPADLPWPLSRNERNVRRDYILRGRTDKNVQVHNNALASALLICKIIYFGK
jgi:hypothetical protein